jgi:outer membrane immunogenic protein
MLRASSRGHDATPNLNSRTRGGEAMFTPFIGTRRPLQRSVLHICLLAAALPCSALRAGAADMPMPSMTAKAPAASVYQWTGCYAGLNAGGGAIGTNFKTTVDAGTFLVGGDPGEINNDGTGSVDGSNFLGGGQAGCNWQTGTIVAGIEGDFDYFRGNSSFFNDTNVLPTSGNTFVIGHSLTTNYLATVRPRLGVAADRNFFYVTGGVAFTQAKYTESYTDGGGGVGVATASRFLTGWVAGAGWQYAISEHWLVRLEYLFAAFPTMTANGVITGPGGSNGFHGSADVTMQVARGGIDFKF